MMQRNRNVANADGAAGKMLGELHEIGADSKSGNPRVHNTCAWDARCTT